MENYGNLTAIIAENLIYYRKKASMTQSEVAAKLCYSDKSVSKWERAEGVPDIHILVQLAKMYGLTVNDFLTKRKKEKIANRFYSRFLITAMSTGLVWFVATIVFFVFRFFLPNLIADFREWLIFIYAIPISCIVMIVFGAIYFHEIFTMCSVSGLIWTLALSIYLTFIEYADIGLIYIVMIPFQVLIIFFFMLLMKRKKK